MSDINSALGLSQLNKVNKFINYRQKIYKNYKKFLINIPHIILPKYNKKNDSAYHLFLISIKSNSKLIKNKLFNFIKTLSWELFNRWEKSWVFRPGLFPVSKNSGRVQSRFELNSPDFSRGLKSKNCQNLGLNGIIPFQ